MSTHPEHVPESPDPLERDLPIGSAIRVLAKEPKMVKLKGDTREECMLVSRQVNPGGEFRFGNREKDAKKQMLLQAGPVQRITQKGDCILFYTKNSIYMLRSADVEVIPPGQETPEVAKEGFLTRLKNVLKRK